MINVYHLNIYRGFRDKSVVQNTCSFSVGPELITQNSNLVAHEMSLFFTAKYYSIV